MEVSVVSRYALSACGLALLAGCGGSQPLIKRAAAKPSAHTGQYCASQNFRKAETGDAETVIYSFGGGSGSMGDGANPRAGLVNVNGTLYGTTFIGGFYNHRFDTHGRGTVFSTTQSGTETVLHRFNGSGDGQYPYASLLDVDGTMYGTTEAGGKKLGTVFSITPNGTETVLHRFGGGADGEGPQAALTDVNGTLYGTTEAGGGIGCSGYGCGTVFKITTSGKETVLHSFRGPGSGDGAGPFAGLVNVNGTLYGTTYYGNASGVYGTVFAITRSGKETVLHGFKGATEEDGAEPQAGLVNVNGTLYGTTFVGGTNSCKDYNQGCGTVFSITPSGKEKVLYSFQGGKSGDGAEPEASLLNVKGTLYGTTYAGGANSGGTIFSITTSGTETVIHSFGVSPGDGKNPEADLIDVNGTLYGTTVFGGSSSCHLGCGTVYSLTGI